MKRIIAATITALLLTGGTAQAAHAATPVPGRYCKTADIGKKVKTTKYGVIVCKKDGSRARWRSV